MKNKLIKWFQQLKYKGHHNNVYLHDENICYKEKTTLLEEKVPYRTLKGSSDSVLHIWNP